MTMKPGHLRELAMILLLFVSILFLGQNNAVPSSSSTHNTNTDSESSCFQSLAGVFHHKLVCNYTNNNNNSTTASSTAAADGDGQKKKKSNQSNPLDVLVGCLEHSPTTTSMMDPSCSSKIADPNTFLSIYKGGTVLFSQENSLLCKDLQDHLLGIDLGTIEVPRPWEPRQAFFGCRAFVHDVMLCCS